MMDIRLFDYTISVRHGTLDSLGDIARAAAPAHRYAIITDEQVAGHHGDRAVRAFGGNRPDIFVIPAGEHEKNRNRWADLTDRLLAAGFGRDSAVIALGGGVVGDLAGFVAATFMRGVPVIQVPTSLLAMIDASIGGKTGVDTPAGKNLVGAFHQPAAVVIDPGVLETLPLAHRRAGIAEAIKHGAIADAAYFEMLEAALPALVEQLPADRVRDMIVRSIEIKASIVRSDERESGPRQLLNFGHTVGHAVEQLSGFSLLHGEAVAIGMVVEARIGERAGITEPGTAKQIERCLVAAGLPVGIPSGIAAADVVRATRSDKKARAGEVRYALPARLGAPAGEADGYAIGIDDRVVAEVIAA